jgi:hypothetical protein
MRLAKQVLANAAGSLKDMWKSPSPLINALASSKRRWLARHSLRHPHSEQGKT